MLIKRVRIQNFRCLQDVEVTFDDITTFIGPNGVGKSSVLRALDWFFNGDRVAQLTEEDIFSGATQEDQRISVEVEFHKLSTHDREALGKYAPDSLDTAVIWRRWENGEDKITGKALAYPPFEDVRRENGAMAKRAAYNKIRGEEPSLSLPQANNVAAVEAAMFEWELQNLDKLVEAEIEGTNFFGFNGQGKLSGIFDFVLVTADLRAVEEAQDSKNAILGRVLEMAVDRTAADSALAELSERLQSEQEAIQIEHFASQLDSISLELSTAVSAFTSGRSVRVSAREIDLKPAKAHFRVSIVDDTVETRVDRQGHGFQRALLISALKLLAERGAAKGNKGVICLAIEEPELFQHPVQARAFAMVLRALAEDPSQGFQVAYATHSSYFIEPRHFEQVRRITRATGSGPRSWHVKISHVTLADVCKHLDGFMTAKQIRKQIDGVCLNRLSDALFADGVALVEGDTEQAVIEGAAVRDRRPLAVSGITVAPVGAKDGLLLAHAILDLSGIPVYVLFDGDKGCADRMRARNKAEKDILSAEKNSASLNKLLLRYLGGAEEDWPATQTNKRFAVFEDMLETQLDAWWLDFVTRKEELVDQGMGFAGKDSLTYRHAAATVAGEIPGQIRDLLDRIRTVARP
jgi:putative ATP-dependent endonuclease of OLD family